MSSIWPCMLWHSRRLWMRYACRTNILFRGGQKTHAPVWPPCSSRAVTTLPPAPGQAHHRHLVGVPQTIPWPCPHGTAAGPVGAEQFLSGTLSLFLGSLSLSLSFALSLTPKPARHSCAVERERETASLAAASSLYLAASSWGVCVCVSGMARLLVGDTTGNPSLCSARFELPCLAWDTGGRKEIEAKELQLI